jgi:hypothetical protein
MPPGIANSLVLVQNQKRQTTLLQVISDGEAGLAPTDYYGLNVIPGHLDLVGAMVASA